MLRGSCDDDLYNTIIENMSDGLIYVEIVLNEKGKCDDFIILNINKSFEKMVNIDRGKLINKRCSEVIFLGESVTLYCNYIFNILILNLNDP